MGNVGPTEILLIALVALLLFGAGRIADIGKGLGQGIKNFKQGLKEASDLDDDSTKKLPEKTAASTSVSKEDPAKAS